MTPRDDAFAALEREHNRLGTIRIEQLVEREPARRDRMVHRLGPLQLDLTRQRIDSAALDALLALANARELRGAIDALFAGEPVNRSERRPALHMALRAPAPLADDRSAFAAAARLAATSADQVERLVDEVRSGEVTDLVHVGIGGSDLGPHLACDALAHEARGGPRVHFVANVDGTRVDRLVRTLDPRSTQVTLVSKSFTTQETLLNARVLREFVGAAAFARRTVAVTANREAAHAFGIDPARILPMWDWVGGRYSIWSAVGFPVAAACGNAVFRRLRAGAQALDAHYASAPFERNLPVLLALAGVWNRNVLGCPTLGIVAYDDRLELLPAFLQQLDMESNGKRVDEHGVPLARPAAPVIWGQVGTNAQHAFFQSLHQGVDTVPLDLVGVVRPCHALRANHDALLANFVAQSAALMLGTRAEDEPDAGLRAQKSSPGDRPHNIVLLDELSPESLGMLLALYEHKVHAQGRIWGVNSFDQWGVELGKKIAQRLQPAIEGGALPAGIDAATAALVREIRSRTN
ncbi:MAG TPA: glucose-6-phosphate isomerase [Candidatus Saccharimonadia bacterium]|nr:glucose-6-phosphate isomerase [Candidatus Saccharimonadia bacterium]